MAKIRTKPDIVATEAVHASGNGSSRPITDADIAQRAYDLYLARGREDGHDVEDWLQAERELHVDAEC